MNDTPKTIYDTYRLHTDKLGDYVAFQHGLRDHMRSELIADVESLSSFFQRDVGLVKGDAYTILLPTSIEAMIVFLALNRLGVIVNFVHPLLPAESLDEILRETASRGIALHERIAEPYVETVRRHALPVLLCARETYEAADKYAARPLPEAYRPLAPVPYAAALAAGASAGAAQLPDSQPSDVAIYLQGGGTTGKSRTIMLTNANIIAFSNNYISNWGFVTHLGIDADINCMPLFHVYGLLSAAVASMVRGFKMILMSKFDADKFIEAMELNHVAQIRGVPNMYRKLVAHPRWDGPHLHWLRSVGCGGDTVTADLRGQVDYTLAKNGSGARLSQGYGLTECCGGVIAHPRTSTNYDALGKALPNVSVQIWDENRRPLPDGEIGEIIISSPTVMLGYLNPERKPDVGIVFGEDGTRWLPTGDLGYRKGDYYYFAGRKKRLIIISGYNAYPLDIEKVVLETGLVSEACAVQGFDADGRTIIRLFLVPAEGAGDTTDLTAKIDAVCRNRLEKLTQPRDFRIISALPRTRVGKVDFMRLTQVAATDPIYCEET